MSTTAPSVPKPEGLRERRVAQIASEHNEADSVKEGLGSSNVLEKEQKTFGRTPEGISEFIPLCALSYWLHLS